MVFRFRSWQYLQNRVTNKKFFIFYFINKTKNSFEENKEKDKKVTLPEVEMRGVQPARNKRLILVFIIDFMLKLKRFY